MENKERLVVSILQFLQSSIGEQSTENAESLQVAMDCIRDVFHVNETETTHQISTPLSKIFDSFIKSNPAELKTSTTATSTAAETPVVPLTKEEITAKVFSEIPPEFTESFKQFLSILEKKGAFADETQYESVLTATKQKFVESKSAEIKAIAEKLKNEGNTKLSAGDNKGALECYNKAILYDNSNAIYFANRAATYAALQEFELSVKDCQEAITRNPNYGKAYTRMGSAYTSLGKFPQAMEAYHKALELEPNNATFKASLENAEKLAAANKSVSSPAAGNGMPNIPGMPDLNGLDLGNLDIGSLLQNPFIKQMAQNMAESGDLSSLMNNPDIMNMMSGMMKGAKK